MPARQQNRRPVPSTEEHDAPSPRLPALLAGILCAASLCCLLAGCATPPPASDPDAVADFKQTNDPLEPTNRVFYAINNGIDTVILQPAAQAYRYVVPEPVRNGVHNVLVNLGTPVQLGQRHAGRQAAPGRRHATCAS